ncbi:MAG: 4-hydroxyphenylpyruvate dioxygenase [Burkholderiaceae bacterium]
MPVSLNREDVPENLNWLAMAGIEFVEYSTQRPQALGQVVETFGFRPVARHRSREVTLYRQGSMNLVINADPDDGWGSEQGAEQPILSAVAFRVQDARRAFRRCLELGAWEVPSRAQAMELHIPALHGPGPSRFYFVDRWEQFSIFDIDFEPIPGVEQTPPALAGMKWFGVVQYVGADRTPDWTAYYEQMFGFASIPENQRYGILPNGSLMSSPCGQFLWQLVEPGPWPIVTDVTESLQRIGIGVPDVAVAVNLLKSRGVEFVDTAHLHPDDRGALTLVVPGGVAFELVHQPD